jgi:hypothetical protein
MVTGGAGGATVAVAPGPNAVAVAVGVAEGTSAGVVLVAVGVAVVVGVAVGVSVGTSVGGATVVSAAGICCAQAGCALNMIDKPKIKTTAPIRAKYSDRECLMGDSPG